MVRGSTRKMLYLPARAGDFFTEAYFVLREEREDAAEGGDLISRAEEIAAAIRLPAPPKKKARPARRFLFLAALCGALAGGGIAALLFLLF